MKNTIIVLTVLLLCVSPTFAQTMDQHGIDGQHLNTQTVTVTVNTQANQVLLLRINWFNQVSPTDTITGVTVNGTSSGVVQISGTLQSNGTSAFSTVMYHVINPTVGTYNAVASFTNTVDGTIEFMTVYGADQITPERSATSSSCLSSCSNSSVTLTTSSASDLIFDGLGDYTAAIINPANGQSNIVNKNHDVIQSVGGDLAGSTGPVTIGWTLTGTSITWAESAVSIQAPFVHPANTKTLLTLGVGK